MRYQRQLGRLLAACTREHLWNEPSLAVSRLLPTVQQQDIPGAAALHRVTGAVAVTLRQEPDMQPEVQAVLRRQRLDLLAAQLRIEADLRSSAEALVGLPWLVTKGPVLAQHYYSQPTLRSYGDLDLLVPPAFLGDAVQALEKCGFVVLDRNWTLMSDLMAGEVHLGTPNGGVLDLHWDLVNDRPTRDRFRMNTADLFSRQRSVDINGQSVHTLDEHDSLIHLGLHAARSGGDRLVWLKDIEQVVLRDRPDWAELGARARTHRASLPLVVMLSRCRATLGAPIPREALAQVGGSRTWRSLVRMIDVVEPSRASGEGGSVTRMVSRATRTDGRDTSIELTRRFTVWASRHPNARSGSPRRTLDPVLLAQVSGGLAERQQFFAKVAKAG